LVWGRLEKAAPFSLSQNAAARASTLGIPRVQDTRIFSARPFFEIKIIFKFSYFSSLLILSQHVNLRGFLGF
jgi:hypothetical protein